MMTKNHDIISVQCMVKHETEKAVLVENIKGKDVWIPKSQCEVEDAGLQIPEWLALDKDLI